ncbi:MAG: DUF1289 domain-containing protein [Alphaproteobacteria bacterium]|nr:DUF1289 domain-containing protein [Alphaproteobacteria bacterium]
MTAPSEPDGKLQRVVSPCAGVCILHTETKLCLGCYRTIEEVAHWQTMSVAEQHRVMGEIAERRRADRGS